MFSIPTIPNDTINKFFVFSGLILTVFGYYMEFSNINEEAEVGIQNRKRQDLYIESLALFNYKASLTATLIECSKAKNYNAMVEIKRSYESQMKKDSSIGLALNFMLLSDTTKHGLEVRVNKVIEELYQLEGEINAQRRTVLDEKLTKRNNPFNHYILFGTIVFIVGYFGWSKAEKRQELHADLQLLKLARELNVDIPHLRKYNNSSSSAINGQTPTSTDIIE